MASSDHHLLLHQSPNLIWRFYYITNRNKIFLFVGIDPRHTLKRKHIFKSTYLPI